MGNQFIEVSIDPSIAYDAQNFERYIHADVLNKHKASHFLVHRRSIDARRGKVQVRLKIELSDKPIDQKKGHWNKSHLKNVSNASEIHIIGAGPAGYFAGIRCIELGFKPVLLERGIDVKSRRRDLAQTNKEHKVNPDSNYCFGEGGAGTYSDGKLYTRSKKRGSVEKVLQMLVAHGATEEILMDAHPHIGTNKLPKVIADIRESIIQSGGEIHFDTRLTDFTLTSDKITEIITNQGKFKCKAVLLATGHSARDIYELLDKKQVKIEAKPFALGIRIEHQQSIIDSIQYKMKDRGGFLPAASYALKHNVAFGDKSEGVFSFCMCPGGFIVPAATANGEVVVNGMSPSKRNSQFSNSGIVVSVHDEDYKPYAKYGELRGMMFQAEVEKRNFLLAGEKQVASAQRMTDFVASKVSKDLPETSYQPGLESVDLRRVLPKKVSQVLHKGLKAFGKSMNGYMTEDAVLVGVESRTSSPVKIPRDKETLQHEGVKNLFPCGEGAGYAGGIVSAAIDGMNCSDAISRYFNQEN